MTAPAAEAAALEVSLALWRTASSVPLSVQLLRAGEHPLLFRPQQQAC